MTSHEMDVAWAAGLFEGEGSITLNRKTSARRELLYGCFAVGMTDEDVIRRLRDVMGFGSIRVEPRSHLGRKDMYVWKTNSRSDFLRAAELLRPWLGARRGTKLKEIEELVSPERRRPPKRRLCKKGHSLTGLNAKPNGRAGGGRPKITCRACVNSNYRTQVVRTTGRVPMSRAIAEQVVCWGDAEVIALKRSATRDLG